MSRARRAALALLALLAGPVRAGLDVEFPDLDSRAGVAIHLRSMLNSPPHAGFAPLRIVIRNEATEARRWSFGFQSFASYMSRGMVSSRTSVEVPAQSEKAVEFLIPVAPLLGGYRYPRINITCNGPGAGGAFLWSGGTTPTFHHSTPPPCLALSQSLANPVWGDLEAHMKSASRELRAAQIDPALLPGDALAWIGWDLVWLTDAEWGAAGPAQRKALTDWVKLGGRLVVVTEGDTPAPAPDLPAAAAANLGAGSVDRIAVRGAGDLRNRILQVLDAVPSLVRTVANEYQAAWPLRRLVPEVHMRTGLISLFVIVFAVIIGPINLVVLARRRRHLHLFWTTPALALLASIGLGAVIVLQDGFGGRGARATLVYLDPAAHQACIWQEQISRTGVLLGRGFARSPGSFLIDLPLYSGGDELAPAASLDNETWSGDWFASRRVQAQLLAAVQPARARVRIGAPRPGEYTVLSELGAPLQRVLYLDAQGKAWQAEQVQPGVRQALVALTDSDRDAAWQKLSRTTGPRLQQVLPERDRAGWFIAEAGEPTEHVLPTLRSIRWTQHTLIYHGPAEVEAGP